MLSSASDRLGTLTEQWFHRAAASLPGRLPCRQGCSRCCVGLFAITILDAERIRAGLKTLSPAIQAAITSKAQEQIDQLEAAAPRLTQALHIDEWSDSELDRLSDQFGHLPCPALNAEGACRVYPYRPITCRTMGIPEEREGLTQGACEVQIFVPIRRLAERLREEERELAGEEALALEAHRRQTRQAGEELWLPYGFVWKFQSRR
jgi:Fe-S-cluster containining protein